MINQSRPGPCVSQGFLRNSVAMAAFACLLLFPLLLRSAEPPQPGATIAGRVQNSAAGTYLNNARITVDGTSIETFTNSFGEYILHDVPAGPAKLRAFYTGLEPQVVQLAVPQGGELEQDFNLGTTTPGAAADKDQPIVLNAFVVAAERETNATYIAQNEQRFSPNIKNVVDSGAFGDVTEGNIGEFVKYLPGVTVDYVAADVRTMAIRGFPDNFTSISFDGSRIASASSGNAQRAFEFEQVSLNNISRVEVVKVPTPDMPFDSMGGAVNLISKSAFERPGTHFSFRTYLNMNSEDTNFLKSTPGPLNKNTYKVLPGGDFDLSIPIGKKFGLVITGLTSNQFNEQHRSQPVWNFAQAGATATNPYLQQYTFQDGPKNTFRQALFLKGEWKISPQQYLSASYQVNHYESNFGNRNLNWDVGTNPASTTTGGQSLTWTPTSTSGATGRGSVRHNTSFRDKYGQLSMASINYRYTGKAWGFEAGLNYSNSHSWYRDTANGHFTETRTTLLNTSRVSYTGIGGERPASLVAYDASGNFIDYTQLGNYRLDTVRTQPVDGKDEYKGAFANLKYTLNVGATPITFKTGFAYRQQDREIYKQDANYTYAGIGGWTGAAAFWDSSYKNQSPYWGFPSSIQWPSPYVAYQLFQTTPAAFTQTVAQQTAAEKYRIRNSQALKEKVPAGFLQAETKLFRNRLQLLGGFRYEKTTDEGDGGLTKGAGATMADIAANWKERGLHVKNSYDNLFPSFNASYNITDSLIARLAYARTIGRPDFSNILPNIRINDTTVSATDDVGAINPMTVIANNTGLKPWRADSFDATLEYYMPRTSGGGSITAGVFRKNLKDFWVNNIRTLTADDATQYALPSSYAGAFTLQTLDNGGDANIEGYEFAFTQPLKFLPGYFRYFTLNGNFTKLHLSGPHGADFQKFIEEAGNIGLSFNKAPFMVMLKLNYRGRQRLLAQTGAQYEATSSSPVNGIYEYYSPRLNLDVNAEYMFTKRLSLFANARNVTNVPQDLQHINPAVTPGYAWLYRRESYGVQISIGVKGSY